MPAYEIEDKNLKKSLNLVIYAITLGMVFFSVFGNPVGSPLFTGFMRILGANDLVYSVVMALPVLGGAAQIAASYYLERTGRRRSLFLIAGFINRLLWIPAAVIPLIMPHSMRYLQIALITIMITISSVGASVASVAFNSWMGDLVPLDIAGRYFGKRTLISTISGAVAGLSVAIFVDRVNNFYGFAIVFIIGALFGAGDISTFFRIEHPPFRKTENQLSLLHVLVLPFKDRNYRRLTIFATLFAFGCNISVPFFNVYMLENLKMNYFLITLSNQIMASLATILLVQKWGSLCDRFGYKPVVMLSGLGVVLCPMTWFFVTSSTISLIFIANIIAGIAWSGYNLAIFNQSVWFAPVRNRSAYIACFTMLTSVVGTAAAYVVGGYFMQYLGPVINSLRIPSILHTTVNSYQALFAVSALVRLLAVIFLLPLVREDQAKTVRVMFRSIWSSFAERYREN